MEGWGRRFSDLLTRYTFFHSPPCYSNGTRELLAVMGIVRHKLMIEESEKRFASAKLLRSAGDSSDSAYLLQLLAFELLLKVVVEQSTQSIAHGHNYKDLFASLSPQRQAEVLRIAGERIGPSLLTTNQNGVLSDLGSNFVKLRYPYDKYNDLTHQEYVRVGADWVAAGARLEDADYRYHPEELFGLTYALRQVVNGC